MTAYSKTPIPCGQCGRKIGARAFHMMLEDNRILCMRCFTGGGRREDYYRCRVAHATFYPDCPVGWHDMHDHPVRFATRAAAHHILQAADSNRAGYSLK